MTANNSLNPSVDQTIRVDTLSDWRKIDVLWWQSDSVIPSTKVALDMHSITSLNPQAIIMLYFLCKKIKGKSSFDVLLKDLSPQVAGYLERVNFFDYSVAYHTGESINFDRNPLTKNLIELTAVNSLLQINKLGDWFYSNFEHWFPDASQTMYRQLAFEAINELCSNSVEHSTFDNNGKGYFLLQRYSDSSDKTNIIMSVGDCGIGIRNHLIRKYPEIDTSTDEEALIQAISGKSGRLQKTGGRGLKSICTLTKDYGGYFIIRSGCGLVFIQNGGITSNTYSYPLTGTTSTFCLRISK